MQTMSPKGQKNLSNFNIWEAVNQQINSFKKNKSTFKKKETYTAALEKYWITLHERVFCPKYEYVVAIF